MRFIKITHPNEISTLKEITKQDLLSVKERYTDVIIDLDSFCYYNAFENRWDKIHEIQDKN